MNAWTDCCLCVFLFLYVRVVGWSVWSTCLQGGAVYISSGEGTFTNCDFTSNSARVSLEEEHVDDCEMSECMMLRLRLSYMSS